MARAPVEEAAHRDKNGNTPDATMGSINDLAVEYGRRIEALLEELGARGPAKGAGELLDQVKHLIDPEDQRKLRWFLKLRNKVVHGRPPHMPMPTREQVERAGRAAVEALERTLAARRDQKAEPNGWQAEPPPGPVYPPRPSLLRRVWRGLSWRVLFLPELAFFALAAVLFAKPAEDFWAWLLVGVLVLRFFALFGDDPLGWKRWTLLGVGALELAFVGVAAADFAARPTELAKHWDAVPTLAIGFLIPGLISFFRGLYLYWRHRHL